MMVFSFLPLCSFFCFCQTFLHSFPFCRRHTAEVGTTRKQTEGVSTHAAGADPLAVRPEGAQGGAFFPFLLFFLSC